MLAVGLLALGVRFWHLAEIEASDPFFYYPAVDPIEYHRWAERIAAGDWLGEGTFFGAPLYPYMLGVLYSLVDIFSDGGD